MIYGILIAAEDSYGYIGPAITAGLALGVLVLIGNHRQGRSLSCPFCRSTVHVGAATCRKCGRDIPRRA